MGVNITTIDYLRVLIIEIGSTIILMVVEAQGLSIQADSLTSIANSQIQLEESWSWMTLTWWAVFRLEGKTAETLGLVHLEFYS